VTESPRRRVPLVMRCRLRSRTGDCNSEERAEGGDAVGLGRPDRGGHRPATRRRSPVCGRRAAPRGAGRRAPHPLRVHDRRVRAPRARDDAGARSRAAAGGARACARSPGDALPLVRTRLTQTDVAASAPCRAAASTSAASRSPPSADPSNGSTACSGCGMRPRTLPASLTTPATLPRAPLTSSV
jgi:hypothetical protein